MKSPFKTIGYLALASTVLSACAFNSTLSRQETEKYYYVFNIRGDIDREDLIDVLDQSMAYNVSDIRSNREIPSMDLPAKPGRFKVKSMGNSMAAMIGLTTVECSGPGIAYTATVTKEVGSSYRTMTACLWAYQGGYHLDTYTEVRKSGGGSLASTIASSLASSLLWTNKEWAQGKTFDAIRKITQLGKVKVDLVAGYPKVKGTPWVSGNYKGAGKHG